MKNLFAVLFFVSLAFCIFGQDMPAPDWSQEITLNAGETINAVALSHEGFRSAWIEVISGRVKINDAENTFCSFCPSSTVVVTAITSATIKISGK